MIDLCTTVYRFRQPERLAEIRECFERNLALSQVDRIFVLAEMVNADEPGYEFLQHPKLSIVTLDRRPTYRDFFELAREECLGRAVCVHNSDIYFDETLTLVERVRSGELWCITRYNILDDGKLKIEKEDGSSHDAWVFRSPIKPFCGDDTALGVLGCDNYIAYKAQEAHIDLRNPALSFVARHLHRSAERNHKLVDGFTYDQVDDYKCCKVPPTK